MGWKQSRKQEERVREVRRPTAQGPVTTWSVWAAEPWGVLGTERADGVQRACCGRLCWPRGEQPAGRARGGGRSLSWGYASNPGSRGPQ